MTTLAEEMDLLDAEGRAYRWWKIPAEKRETYERNQSAFEEQFGDFPRVQIVRSGVAASPDGKWVGFEFQLEDGTRFRGALPWATVHVDLAAMIMLALERCVVRAMSTAGASKN